MNRKDIYLVSSKESDVAGQQNVESIDLSFFKILIAEENLIDHRPLQEMLIRMKIQFRIVNNGQEVLDALQNEYFDLVLMNYHMNIMGGAEATVNIRKSTERFASIPLIVFTGDSFNESDAEICRRVGISDYVVKPVTYDQLKSKIQEWSGRIFEELPVLDTSALEKIRIFDDHHQTLLRSLLQIYSENTQEELYKMRDLIQDGRVDLLRKKAHMLKSSAAQLGALRFEKFCVLMEHEENMDSERAKKLHTKMCNEYENSRARFLQYCQNIGQISSAQT